MENLVHYIYICVGVIVGIYLFITKRDSRKSLLMLLLSLIAFYSSAYVFYFITKPINLICTGLILVLWIIVLRLVKKFNSNKEQFFWNICVIYVAIYHILHYIFDPIAHKNIMYAFVFVIYTNVGILLLGLYYFLRVYKK